MGEPSHAPEDQLKVVEKSTDKSEDLDADMSSYWSQRASNIQANKNFLASLKIEEDKMQLKKLSKKRTATNRGLKSKKESVPKNRRQSLRQRHSDPEYDITIDNIDKINTLVTGRTELSGYFGDTRRLSDGFLLMEDNMPSFQKYKFQKMVTTTKWLVKNK